MSTTSSSSTISSNPSDSSTITDSSGLSTGTSISNWLYSSNCAIPADILAPDSSSSSILESLSNTGIGDSVGSFNISSGLSLGIKPFFNSSIIFRNDPYSLSCFIINILQAPPRSLSNFLAHAAVISFLYCRTSSPTQINTVFFLISSIRYTLWLSNSNLSNSIRSPFSLIVNNFIKLSLENFFIFFTFYF